MLRQVELIHRVVIIMSIIRCQERSMLAVKSFGGVGSGLNGERGLQGGPSKGGVSPDVSLI